jgi:hypothetical protein
LCIPHDLGELCYTHRLDLVRIASPVCLLGCRNPDNTHGETEFRNIKLSDLWETVRDLAYTAARKAKRVPARRSLSVPQLDTALRNAAILAKSTRSEKKAAPGEEGGGGPWGRGAGGGAIGERKSTRRWGVGGSRGRW